MARLPISTRFIENSMLGVGAFVLSSALIRMLTSGNTDLVTAGDRRFEIVLVLVYLGIVLIGVAHLRRTARFALSSPSLVALVVLTSASFLWAELPGLVARRTVGVLGATLFGVVMASRLDFGEQLSILRKVGRLATALSYAAWPLGLASGTSLVSGEATTIKGYQVAIEEGAWRGIFNHKNDLGAMMALAILVEWHIPARTTPSKIAKAIWLCAYSVLLLLSHSVTSLIAVGLTILIVLAIKTFRHQYRVVVPVLLLVTMFSGTLIALNATSVTGALGRSADLSGRADLWSWSVVMILKRPFLGYGFSGFWKGASEQSSVIEDRIGWSPVYAHNGYLEILLSLGAAGLLLFLWFAASGIRRAAILAKRAESIQDLWPLVFLIYFLIHNLGECTILWQNSLEWGICVATVAGAAPHLHEYFVRVPEEDQAAIEIIPELT